MCPDGYLVAFNGKRFTDEAAFTLEVNAIDSIVLILLTRWRTGLLLQKGT